MSEHENRQNCELLEWRDRATERVHPAPQAREADPQEWRGAITDFAQSELFERTFADGMELVEETASYLDGQGREESKFLSRKAALAYAGESMRLTTRLMQVASWLLVQKAIREGEMTPEEACLDKYRLGAQEICRGAPLEAVEELPGMLIHLLEQSELLYDRVDRLDERMYRRSGRDDAGEQETIQDQHSRILQAFGGLAASRAE